MVNKRFRRVEGEARLPPVSTGRLATHLLGHSAEIGVRLVERSVAAIFQHRSSFVRFGLKVWNSEIDPRWEVIGRGKKNTGRLAVMLIEEILLST